MNNILNLDYLQGLQQKIPVLQDETLLQHILIYANKMANNGDINPILSKINELLKSENNIYFQSYTYENNNGTSYVKAHKLNTASIIEAIIEYTLHFYDPSSCPDLISMEINNIPNKNYPENIKKRFKQKMEIVPESEYISFGDYVVQYFNSPDSNYQEFKNTLIAIANKINHLQQFGFIHGDFHSGNIYINPTNNEVRIIDFGYSCIKLPLNSRNLLDFLLCVPISAYKQNNILRLPYNDNLKKIDLFHLIYELSTSDIPLLNIFINNIFEYCGNEKIKDELSKVKEKHKFICSNKLEEISNFFIPEIFIGEINKVSMDLQQSILQQSVSTERRNTRELKKMKFYINSMNQNESPQVVKKLRFRFGNNNEN